MIDGAGTRTETRERIQDENGGGNGDGSEDGKKGNSVDGKGDGSGNGDKSGDGNRDENGEGKMGEEDLWNLSRKKKKVQDQALPLRTQHHFYRQYVAPEGPVASGARPGACPTPTM